MFHYRHHFAFKQKCICNFYKLQNKLYVELLNFISFPTKLVSKISEMYNCSKLLFCQILHYRHCIAINQNAIKTFSKLKTNGVVSFYAEQALPQYHFHKFLNWFDTLNKCFTAVFEFKREKELNKTKTECAGGFRQVCLVVSDLRRCSDMVAARAVLPLDPLPRPSRVRG